MGSRKWDVCGRGCLCGGGPKHAGSAADTLGTAKQYLGRAADALSGLLGSSLAHACIEVFSSLLSHEHRQATGALCGI
eukprot:1160624-Pelagomonas_calceolata.AAC.2